MKAHFSSMSSYTRSSAHLILRKSFITASHAPGSSQRSSQLASISAPVAASPDAAAAAAFAALLPSLTSILICHATNHEQNRHELAQPITSTANP